ncbi:hypothetical protein [Alkalihalobacillus sp. AL-G]|uniref:hypothetical protein n=1 Tax=Alkalihalobacillus sp. AL-G TaxID=2926399 RepID=UPI002729A7DB|nr:hypothetical protein [Alkalihalobacillus sp. AL-G]WLD92430.1 hypothetical protein MOJ78_15605 [Alkalihalobacillus sp. AL-G]
MNKKADNLFDDFQPLKRNEKAYNRLERKLNNRSNSFFIKQPIMKFSAAIIVLFVFIGSVTIFFSGLSFSPFTSSSPEDTEMAKVTKRHYIFSDESEHWTAKVISNSIQLVSEQNNTVQLEGSSESNLHLTFKGKDVKSISGFSYKIEGPGFSSELNESNPFYNGNTLTSHLTNDIIYKNESIKVKVTWNGNQESLTLTYDDSSSSESQYKRALNLSPVTMKTYEESFAKWDTNGFVGDEGFQISTVSWDEKMILFDHFEPSLLAKGGSLTQSVIFTFPDQELFPYKLRIKAKHSDGHEMMIWKGDVSTQYAKQYNDRLAVPAVVKFGKEGKWKLTAFYEDEKLGTVSIDVRKQNDPPEYNMLFQDDNVWGYNFGIRSLIEKSSVTPNAPVLVTGKNHMQKVAWLFRNISDGPVIIIGQHESGIEHFVSTFDSLMAGIHGADFHHIDGPRFEKEGTWNVKAFADGEYLGKITFLVRHTE